MLYANKKGDIMKVLVACEFSGIVRGAFLKVLRSSLFGGFFIERVVL